MGVASAERYEEILSAVSFRRFKFGHESHGKKLIKPATNELNLYG